MTAFPSQQCCPDYKASFFVLEKAFQKLISGLMKLAVEEAKDKRDNI